MHNFLIHNGILVVYLLLRNEMQIVWQILDVPNVVLDLLKRDTLYRVRLQHAVYKILHSWRQMAGYIISTLFYLVE